VCCTAWYRMCIRTPYTPGRGVCRVSECRLYSSVYYRMFILTPYTPAYSVAEESAHDRGECRVSGGLMDPTAGYPMCMVTRFFVT